MCVENHSIICGLWEKNISSPPMKIAMESPDAEIMSYPFITSPSKAPNWVDVSGPGGNEAMKKHIWRVKNVTKRVKKKNVWPCDTNLHSDICPENDICHDVSHFASLPESQDILWMFAKSESPVEPMIYPYAPWCWYIDLHHWVIFGKCCSIFHNIPYMEHMGYTHRCPFPIGWLINRGCLPLSQSVNDDADGIPVTGSIFTGHDIGL